MGGGIFVHASLTDILSECHKKAGFFLHFLLYHLILVAGQDNLGRVQFFGGQGKE